MSSEYYPRDYDNQFGDIAAYLLSDPNFASNISNELQLQEINDEFAKSQRNSDLRRLERAAKMSIFEKIKNRGRSGRSAKVLAVIALATSAPAVYISARNVAEETQSLSCPTSVNTLVAPGDTAWGLVTAANGNDIDPRALVAEFKEINNNSDTVLIGANVKVPICNK